MARCVLAGNVDARCGVLSVAEDPSNPSGRMIDLKVEVIPAQSTSTAADPVFFLSGGPGGAATEDWVTAPRTFEGLNLRHDIVLVDQRGTGGSHRLVVPTMEPGEALADYARRALAGIDGDPRFYTTSVAMDDIDAVRRSLGYDRIDLYGASYGATAAQYYLRQHNDYVGAVVLDGATLLDVPIMELVAANSQRALDDLVARCLADSSCRGTYPNLRDEMATVFSRLDKEPVKTAVVDPATGQPVTVTRDYLAGVIHNRLITAANAATIPSLVHRAWLGDFTDVAQSSGAVVPTLVMSLEIRCSEAWARFDPAAVQRSGQGSYYVSSQLTMATLQAAACPLLPTGFVPANDSEAVHSMAPVLLLTGGDDPQDPPSSVAAAPQQMPNSLTVIVPSQGHTVGHLSCLPAVVVRFFDAGKPDAPGAQACAAKVPVPAFQLS